MSKPASAAIDWITCAACNVSGLVGTVKVKLGLGAFASANSCFALATSRPGTGTDLT